MEFKIRLFICLLLIVFGSVGWSPEVGAQRCRPGYPDCNQNEVCINCGSGFVCAVAPAQCCGTGICGAGMVCINCGMGPRCAVPPAVCCGTGICGAGMVCLNCGMGPICAVPPAVCCGNGICGDGMVCINCGMGPRCAVPPAVCCGNGICGAGMRCITTAQGPRCYQPTPQPQAPIRQQPQQGQPNPPQNTSACDPICDQYCRSIGNNGGRVSPNGVCILGQLSGSPVQVCTCW
jgi:hypothetical protein